VGFRVELKVIGKYADFMMKFILLVIVFVPQFSWASEPLEATSDIYNILEGQWEWRSDDKTCATNPHNISFNDNRTEMYINYIKSTDGFEEKPLTTARYEILDVDDLVLKMAIIGEVRKDAHDADVIWDLVLLSRAEYCWRRQDWDIDSCTVSNYRCP
jgi:hypothetical protein